MPILFFVYLEKIANIRKYRKKMMNISPMVNSVKCTVFSRFVQFWHVLVLEACAYLKILLALLKNPGKKCTIMLAI